MNTTSHMSHLLPLAADALLAASFGTANALAVNEWAKACTSVVALLYFSVRLYRYAKSASNRDSKLEERDES